MDKSKLVENKMDKNMDKNKTEKNDVEKAAPAIVLQLRQLPELPQQRGELLLLNGPLDLGPLGERVFA